jgi:deoxyribonuclease-4
MLLIGSHVSFNSKEQLLGSVKEALSYGENTFMFYTGAPQNTKRCELDYDLTLEARNLLYENNIDLKNIIVHAPYIINLANNEDETKYNFAINFLKDEIKRVYALGVEKLVLHPGSFVNLDLDVGINNIINALNEVITPNQAVKICLETMAGKGTETCFKLEHIKRIIDGVKYPDKLMVCLDTCHLNDAGYDMKDFDKFLEEFDNIIGIDKIGCVHVNDSKNLVGSHKDRHENIGYGTIGFDSLIKIIYNKKLDDVPKILETPYISKESGNDRSYPPYKFEIEMIKSKKFNNNLYDDVRSFYK